MISCEANWSRAMLDKSTHHENDVVFLLLLRAIFQETYTEMDVKTVNVIVKKQIGTNFSSSDIPCLSDTLACGSCAT